MPPPASRATSWIWASTPCSATIRRAAAMIASRLRCASARSGRGVVAVGGSRSSPSRKSGLTNGTEIPYRAGGNRNRSSSSAKGQALLMESADTPRAKWLALALLAAAQFVVVLDASIVNVALPSIGKDLQFSQDDLSWVVNAYTLFFGGFLLLGGRLADRLGRRRMFIAGMVVFAGASLMGGLAQSDTWLVIARAFQGLGAALISPAALSIVTTTFAEGAERNKALGVWGAVAGSGGAVGVLLGGVLTKYAGWEWVLFVNVPIGLAAAFLAPRILLESRDHETKRFDVFGAVTVTGGLALLVYTLVNANKAGWASAVTIVLG